MKINAPFYTWTTVTREANAIHRYTFAIYHALVTFWILFLFVLYVLIILHNISQNLMSNVHISISNDLAPISNGNILRAI